MCIDACPAQAIQLWQYSEGAGLGYSMLTDDMKPIERFGYMQQWAEHIPPGSEALTAVKTEGVHFLAFRHPKTQTMALFCGNNSADTKKFTVKGLPASVTKLNAVHTLKGTIFQKFAGPTPKTGTITLDIPPYSFTTLYGSYGSSTTLKSKSLLSGGAHKGFYILEPDRMIPGIANRSTPFYMQGLEFPGVSIFDVKGKRMILKGAESGRLLPRVEAGPSEGANR